MRNLLSLACLGSSLLTAACLDRSDATDTDAETTETAEAAIDATDAASAEGNVMMATVGGAEGALLVGVTAEVAAARIAANVSARYQPAGCATVTRSGAAIRAVFDDCTGPRGLAHVSGELALAVAVSLDGAITLHGTSDALRVNGATLDVDATAVYTPSISGHELAVRTTSSGTGPRGRDVEHDGDYRITWDAATLCHTIDGAWSTQIGDRTRSHEVRMARCAGECPTGTITRASLRGDVTITFDGSPIATWTTSAGLSGTVELRCR
jgi:hypothetical protein